MNREKIENSMPEKALGALFEKLFPGEYKKELKVAMVTSIASAFLCYFMLMVTGYAGPDAIGEGINMYQGFGWAVSIGRWFLAYTETRLVGSAVIPFLIVIMYSVLIGLSSISVFRLFKIEGTFVQILLTALFVSFPVVTMQFGFLYMAVYYAFSFFCATFGVLLIRKRKVWTCVLAAVLFTCMLGSYQVYIGAVAALAIMLVITDICDNKPKKSAFLDLGLTAGIGAVSCVLDLLIMKFAMAKEGMEAAERVDGFSLKDIFENFGFSFKYSVVWFFSYFKDELFSRNLLYLVTFVLIILGFILCLVNIIKEKRYADVVLLIVFLYLIPHTMNICQYLFPHNGIFDIMRYHYVLIFAFMIAIIKRSSFSLPKSILLWGSYIVIFVLINTYALSANIGAIKYKIIYTQNYTEASAMVNRVYALDGYVPNETKVILARPIDWSNLQGHFGLLFSETVIGAGPIYWNDFIGLNLDRRNYFLNYLGVDFGLISIEEYNGACQTKEYEEMPVWPAEGSVRMINGCAVIKNE